MHPYDRHMHDDALQCTLAFNTLPCLLTYHMVMVHYNALYKVHCLVIPIFFAFQHCSEYFALQQGNTHMHRTDSIAMNLACSMINDASHCTGLHIK